jgi:hypothetical protein
LLLGHHIEFKLATPVEHWPLAYCLLICSTNITGCKTIISLLVSFECGSHSLREEYRLKVFKSKNTRRVEVGKPEGMRPLERPILILNRH